MTSDRVTNTVIISGPADKILQAKEILSKIDVKQFEGQQGILTGKPEFQNHHLPGGGAETTQKLLTEVYKDDPAVRIQVSGPDKLFVYADPQTHLDLRSIITANFQPTLLKSELLILYRLDPFYFADSVKSMLKDGPYIEADRDNNGIRVRGTEEQIKDVKTIIKAFDDNPFTGEGGNTRIINLDKGSGATVAEALYLLLMKMRPDAKIDLLVPTNPEQNFKKEEKKKPEEKKPEEKKLSTQITPNTVRELIYLNNPPLHTTAYNGQEGKEQKLPGKKGPSIAITGFGNKLMITGDDPKLLDAAQQMIRILVAPKRALAISVIACASPWSRSPRSSMKFNGKPAPAAARSRSGRRCGGSPFGNIPAWAGLTALIPGMGGGQPSGR